MQSPKTLITSVALGAALLTTQAVAQPAAPDSHLANSTQGVKVQNATVKLGGVSTDASDAGKSSKAKPQERPGMRKYSSMGKYGKPSTATITLGASDKDGQSAGKKVKACVLRDQSGTFLASVSSHAKKGVVRRSPSSPRTFVFAWCLLCRLRHHEAEPPLRRPSK